MAKTGESLAINKEKRGMIPIFLSWKEEE